MLDRFYFPGNLAVERMQLAGTEAHHLTDVLRGRIGGRVCLFDGQGNEATAEIVATARGVVDLRVLATQAGTEPSRPSLVLATAVPKGDRFRWLVEKATELGVARLVPLQTTHSVVDPGFGKLDKMQQAVIAACKQCGRNRLMPIDSLTDWPAFVSREFSHAAAFVAYQQGEPLSYESHRKAARNSESIVVAIGPEGGWTEAEINLAVEHGAKPLSLGPQTLRIETAAIAVAAIFGISSRL